VVYAEEDFALGEVHQQRYEIASPTLNFGVVLFGDGVDAQVHLRATRHAHGYFFTQEKIAVFAEAFRGIDGIVVGEGHDGHPEALTTGIYLGSFIIRLFADSA
jgi:hypothetical protein